jgi:hypothetical protein
VSAPAKKIILPRELSNLGMQDLQINRRLCRCGSTAKKVGRSLAELHYPLRNLVGMYFKPLGQFGQRHVTAQ